MRKFCIEKIRARSNLLARVAKAKKEDPGSLPRLQQEMRASLVDFSFFEQCRWSEGKPMGKTTIAERRFWTFQFYACMKDPEAVAMKKHLARMALLGCFLVVLVENAGLQAMGAFVH